MKNIFPLILLAFVSVSASAASIPDAPSLDAKSYALLDYTSGQLIAGRDADLRVEPASITKVMTAYVAYDEIRQGRIKLEDEVLISERAWRQGIDSTQSRMFIEVGKRVKLEDLLRGIIISSGNDATVALAEHIAGSEEVFAELMNQYAKKLGMKNTHFTDASGMPDPAHYTTAYDLTLLGLAFIRDFPEPYKMFSEREFFFNGIKQQNRNMLLEMDPTFDGIKTGHTEAAGYCLLSSSQRDGRRLIAALMGSSGTGQRARDSKALVDYGFRFFESVQMYGANQPAATVPLWKGEADELQIGTLNPITLALPRGASSGLQVSQTVEPAIVAPITQGQALGTLTLSLDGKVLRTEPLVALHAVAEGGFFKRLWHAILMWWAS